MSPGGARTGALAALLAPALGRVRPSGEGDPSVAWYRVDPRFLRQTDPEVQTVAYVSHGERDTGNLTLYLDVAHEVASFELTYDRFMGDGELYFVWDRSEGIRSGDLDTGGKTGNLGPRIRMSPVIRYRRLSATDLGRLLGYVERSAGTLASNHRETVLDVLRAALASSGT
jgi:hypothetical protein